MHERYRLRWALLATLTLACTTSAPDAGTEATGFGIAPAHTNAQPTDVVASPLEPAWIALLDGGTVSYPLVAGGRVIVALLDVDSGQSTVASSGRGGGGAVAVRQKMRKQSAACDLNRKAGLGPRGELG